MSVIYRRCQLLRLCSVGGRWISGYGALLGNRIIGAKSVTLPLHPPQIPNAQVWDQPRVSEVTGLKIFVLSCQVLEIRLFHGQA